MEINKMKEVKKHIEQLQKMGLPLTRVNLAKLVNMHISSYVVKYLDKEVNDYIKSVSAQAKHEELMKLFKDYIRTLIVEKQSITYENIAKLHGVTSSRAKIVFGGNEFKEYISEMKKDNKILSANEEFKDFYFKHAPFNHFKDMKASEVFEKYGQDYFDSLQHFCVFCSYYNVPFKAVNKKSTKNSEVTSDNTTEELLESKKQK